MTLSEVFFELEENLCQRYTALTPFVIRREKFGEVTKLVRRVNEKLAREQGATSGDKVIKYKNGDVHIRRKAMNDNWY